MLTCSLIPSVIAFFCLFSSYHSHNVHGLEPPSFYGQATKIITNGKEPNIMKDGTECRGAVSTVDGSEFKHSTPVSHNHSPLDAGDPLVSLPNQPVRKVNPASTESLKGNSRPTLKGNPTSPGNSKDGLVSKNQHHSEPPSDSPEELSIRVKNRPKFSLCRWVGEIWGKFVSANEKTIKPDFPYGRS
ncbi:hypothetical protein PGTUg99_032685 [Puccinia graminis f. sp. tritici]|uniref:Uncharacterized protein n=1 Tax=Puccinia graminis f. sp. tritici TaxID=56615 RepID=A0A5B0Q8Y7_PUCGR|nr:hypothetical protein PGTUg99_032685 [Puccinia graminis f. sp. tritici]